MSEKRVGSSGRKHILQGHKRDGKRFIPPFLHMIGPLSEVSWVDELMPELIWIGLPISLFGYSRGVDIALQLSKAATKAHETDECEFFAWLSTFEQLSSEEWATIRSDLTDLGVLPDIVHALRPLLILYPESPIAPLAQNDASPAESHLAVMKDVVQQMYPRREVFATRVQSTAVYFAFVAGCLKVATETSLADFPEVENYPNTEASQAVASSVRATLNFLYGTARERFPTEWPITFWNRGLELEECQGLTQYMAKQHGQEDG